MILLEMKIEDELTRIDEALVTSDEGPGTLEEERKGTDERGSIGPDDETTIAEDGSATLDEAKSGTEEEPTMADEDDRGIREEDVGFDEEPPPQVYTLEKLRYISPYSVGILGVSYLFFVTVVVPT